MMTDKSPVEQGVWYIGRQIIKEDTERCVDFRAETNSSPWSCAYMCIDEGKKRREL